MTVHLFGATSSPSCAIYALQSCAKDKSAHHRSEAIQTVLRNFYVDDCLTSVATEQQGIALMHELREVCASGGFNLTKWMSNSRTVLASISEESKAKTVKDLDLEKDKLPMERALGVQWCVETDTLQFKVTLQEKHITDNHITDITSIFLARCSSKTNSIMKDRTHPSHSLFQLLPSGRRYRSIRARSTRLLNSFFPQAVRALNSDHPAPL